MAMFYQSTQKLCAQAFCCVIFFVWVSDAYAAVSPKDAKIKAANEHYIKKLKKQKQAEKQANKTSPASNNTNKLTKKHSI